MKTMIDATGLLPGDTQGEHHEPQPAYVFRRHEMEMQTGAGVVLCPAAIPEIVKRRLKPVVAYGEG